MNSRLRPHDEGATLVIVLVLVTVISVLLGAVIKTGDTNVRATVALRVESAHDYSSDAAASAAIQQLLNSSANFSCANATTPSSVTLGSGSGAGAFYKSVNNSGSYNAVATCLPDSNNGVIPGTPGSSQIGPTNTPTYALLTVGQNYPTEDGIDEIGNWTMCVQNGSVASYSTVSGGIAAGVSTPASTTACPNTAKSGITVSAYGAPAPPTSGCLGTAAQYSPTPCTAGGLGGVPTVPAPTYGITAANTNQAAVCQKTGGVEYAAILPGKYSLLTSTTAASLSTPCRSGSTWVAADVLWLTPGTYYFDFGSTSWTVPATMIGGTPTTPAGATILGLNGTNATTLAASTLSNLSQATAFPGACISPSTQSGNGGVEMVFGGASTMTFPSSGKLDVCATYVDANTVPVALYGVYQNPLAVGSGSVSPESGCVATAGCSGANSLMIPASPNGHESFHFEGYVWAPAAGIIMTYKNSAGQEFNWGVVTRTFQITGNGVSPSGAFISLPQSSFGPQPTYTIRYINVYICTAATTACSASGTPNVRVKIQSTIGSGGNITGNKILSWSHLH